ncbi:hypothetical protein BH11GEM2_BH11GEM2_38210 [soil metagenome]
MMRDVAQSLRDTAAEWDDRPGLVTYLEYAAEQVERLATEVYFAHRTMVSHCSHCPDCTPTADERPDREWHGFAIPRTDDEIAAMRAHARHERARDSYTEPAPPTHDGTP